MKQEAVTSLQCSAEGDLVVAVGGAGHAQGEMVEDALMEAVADGEAMRRRQIDTRAWRRASARVMSGAEWFSSGMGQGSFCGGMRLVGGAVG